MNDLDQLLINNINKYSKSHNVGMFISYKDFTVKGIICNNNVRMQTIQIWNALPQDRHLGSDIWIMRDDECDINGVCTAAGDIATRTDTENDEN